MEINENVEQNTVDFEMLNPGDCFKDEDGDVMIKIDWEQNAVLLRNGVVFSSQCGKMVTPINAEVRIINKQSQVPVNLRGIHKGDIKVLSVMDI